MEKLELEIRTNVGSRNPYALADYIDSKMKKPKKEWRRILMGWDMEYKDLESALQESLKYKNKIRELFPDSEFVSLSSSEGE